MKYFIIEDIDGFFITETPDSTDIIHHECDDLFEAECLLLREINRSE